MKQPKKRSLRDLQAHADYMIVKRRIQLENHSRRKRQKTLSEMRSRSSHVLARSREILQSKSREKEDSKLKSRGGVFVDKIRTLRQQSMVNAEKTLMSKREKYGPNLFHFQGKTYGGFDELKPEFQNRVKAQKEYGYFDFDGTWNRTQVSPEKAGNKLNYRSKSARKLRKTFNEKLRENERKFTKFGRGILAKGPTKPRYMQLTMNMVEREKAVLREKMGNVNDTIGTSEPDYSRGLHISKCSHLTNRSNSRSRSSMRAVGFSDQKKLNKEFERAFKKSNTPEFKKTDRSRSKRSGRKSKKQRKKKGKWHNMYNHDDIYCRSKEYLRNKNLRIKEKIENERRKMDQHGNRTDHRGIRVQDYLRKAGDQRSLSKKSKSRQKMVNYVNFDIYDLSMVDGLVGKARRSHRQTSPFK